MKRKTAKEILSDSFRELAQVKPVDRITVKDITDNCGYSPATFYRQFKDKYDLIAWEFPEIYEVFSARRSWMRKPSGRNRIDVPFLTGIPLVADLRHAL